MKLTYPRIIHSEMMTHRMFSRNSASSRAIPFKKMVESVKQNPFIPMAWQKDHKGMQGTEYFPQEGFTAEEGIGEEGLKDYWLAARDRAIQVAESLNNNNVTKQLCNRLLEPFMYHTVLVTATEWENFFKLRCPQYETSEDSDGNGTLYHRSWKDLVKHIQDTANNRNHPKEKFDAVLADKLAAKTTLERLSYNKGQAEIHMMAVAEAMWDSLNESTPKQLQAGEWHIPFGDDIEYHVGSKGHDTLCEKMITGSEMSIKVATARCARVSYTVVGEEGKSVNYENDLKLHDTLAASGHWSPFEHCARAMTDLERSSFANGIVKLHMGQSGDVTGCSIGGPNESFGWCRNFIGWIQYRSLIEKSI